MKTGVFIVFGEKKIKWGKNFLENITTKSSAIHSTNLVILKMIKNRFLSAGAGSK